MTSTRLGYLVREARAADMPGARSVMLDTFYRVFGYGYMPEHHDDVIHPAAAYLGNPRQRLWIAEHEGEVVATTAIRARGPRHPPHPQWLVDRYPDATTAQLFRVYVRPEHQRQGLASELVRHAIEFVRCAADFDRLYLHTDTRTPGALEFWQTFGAIVHDGRGPETVYQTVHLEIPL
ncbi:GNAT family N-acetyltransferase [Nocardia huaxiensis]|uniref:GNAT family N-acetyltransferase n=1 Tax=Nocardia huaxiensis TaxID=2755382 RepID=A0A7D6ZKM1_9NOCA|nr:GNAT family N-acetyltransferase [Nocardia huaxiensis]QLY27905.1 GNAT family N-acetyltransferase [Nocardia huaxiensis]UFS98691.1 GNAT family N-acetyltransferase [Nocardia huaxiensis]